MCHGIGGGSAPPLALGRSFASRSLSWRRVSLLHEPSALAPLNEIVLSKEGGLLRSAYVVANFLLPRLKSNSSRLTQALVKLGCEIPKQICRESFHHVPSPMDASSERRRPGRLGGRSSLSCNCGRVSDEGTVASKTAVDVFR